MTNHVFLYIGDTQEEDVYNDDNNGHDEQQVQAESSHLVLDVDQLSSSVSNHPSPSPQLISYSVRNDPSPSAQLISSSFRNDPTPSSTLFVRRRFQCLLLEQSFRRRIRIWVVMELLIHNMMTRPGSERAVIFLRVIQNLVRLSQQGATPESQIEFNQEIQQTHEIQQVKEEIQEVKEKDQEIQDVKEDETQELPEIGQEIQDVKEEETQELQETDQSLKTLSDWWGNTRNIMAMVAILFVTLSITASFNPPHGILEHSYVATIFIIAVHLSLMTSMAVLFFLFSITASSPKIEKRLLQISNLGLWSSLLGLTIAYISNLWMLEIHTNLKRILAVTTISGFLLLFSFLFSRRVRLASHGCSILHETNGDVPYVLTEIFNAQETVQS